MPKSTRWGFPREGPRGSEGRGPSHLDPRGRRSRLRAAHSGGANPGSGQVAHPMWLGTRHTARRPSTAASGVFDTLHVCLPAGGLGTGVAGTPLPGAFLAGLRPWLSSRGGRKSAHGRLHGTHLPVRVSKDSEKPKGRGSERESIRVTAWSLGTAQCHSPMQRHTPRPGVTHRQGVCQSHPKQPGRVCAVTI